MARTRKRKLVRHLQLKHRNVPNLSYLRRRLMRLIRGRGRR